MWVQLSIEVEGALAKSAPLLFEQSLDGHINRESGGEYSLSMLDNGFEVQNSHPGVVRMMEVISKFFPDTVFAVTIDDTGDGDWINYIRNGMYYSVDKEYPPFDESRMPKEVYENTSDL